MAVGACVVTVEAAGWAAMGLVETGGTEADGWLKPMDLPAHGEVMAAAGVTAGLVMALAGAVRCKEVQEVSRGGLGSAPGCSALY